MPGQRRSSIADVVRQNASPLTGSSTDFDALLDMVGGARLVLIGEASHGTHEFYRNRAEITKRLITDMGFTAVAVEADWPDAYRVNRFVRGGGDGATAVEALADFKRFPNWMWRNADVLDFVGWLSDYNRGLPRGAAPAGFYGLDLYSLHASMEAVITYLDQVDPEAAKRARARYACFEHFGVDPQTYGALTTFHGEETCEADVVRQLVDLQQKAAAYASGDGALAEDEAFFATQNARVAANAEEYYRSMFRSDRNSWNIRDQHMTETLVELLGHLDRHGGRSKVVVWEHNSHLGDARATQMGESGEVNVGQLVRERFGDQAMLVGFSTYGGTVTAASDWGEPAERKTVRPGLAGSYEELFHEVNIPAFFLNLRHDDLATATLRRQRLERAIGVVYLPRSERLSHYFYAQLPRQFDALLYYDETRAVEPLERTSIWESGEAPETYPFAV